MVGNLPTNCLSVFDHFMKMALKYKLLKGWLDCFYERTTLITSWFLIILRQRLILKRTCERYVIQSNSFDIISHNSSFLKCTRQEGLRSSNSSELYPLNIFGFSLVPKILQKNEKDPALVLQLSNQWDKCRKLSHTSCQVQSSAIGVRRVSTYA